MKLFILASLLSITLSQTTVDYIESGPFASQLTTFARALNETGLRDVVNNGTFTILPPNNAAFDALGPGVVDILFQNIPILTQIVQYHILPGSFPIQLLGPNGAQFETTLEQNITVSIGSQGLGFLDSTGAFRLVAIPGAPGQGEVSNGVVHIMADVMQPVLTTPTTTASPQTTLSNITTTANATLTPTGTGTGTSTTATGTATSSTATGTATNSTTTTPIGTATGTGTSTTSGPSLPEQNAKDIKELQIRVAALERVLANCNCNKGKGPSKGKGIQPKSNPGKSKSRWGSNWGSSWGNSWSSRSKNQGRRYFMTSKRRPYSSFW